MRAHVLAVLVALAAAPGGALSLERCASARYVLRGGVPLVASAGSPAVQLLALEGGRMSVEGACGPARFRRRATRKGTVLEARWRRCGSRRKVVLRAALPHGRACEAFDGMLRARGVAPRPFRAARSTCGDGVVDPGLGERCEGPDACAAGLVCRACVCVPPAVTPSSTTTTLVPGASSTCGNGVRESGEACDGADLGGFACPEGGAAACAPGCAGVDPTGCYRCGNGVREGREQCDDGNEIDGDGCAASCLLEDAFAGGADGDTGAIDPCMLVWSVWGLTPAPTNSCVDGRACDRDAERNGACVFRVGVCANESQSPQAGPVLCRPSDLAAVGIAPPSVLDEMQQDALLDALDRLLAGAGGVVSRAGAAVSVVPPYQERGRCEQFDLTVAAGGTTDLAVTAADSGGALDADRLHFACVP